MPTGNRAIYKEWVDLRCWPSVKWHNNQHDDCGHFTRRRRTLYWVFLDQLHGGRSGFALFLMLLSVGDRWKANTSRWKVRTSLQALNIHTYPCQFCPCLLHECVYVCVYVYVCQCLCVRECACVDRIKFKCTLFWHNYILSVHSILCHCITFEEVKLTGLYTEKELTQWVATK